MTEQARYELSQLRDDTGEPEPESPWRERALEAFDRLKPRTSPAVKRKARVVLMPNGRRFALTFEYPDHDDAWHFGPTFEVANDTGGEHLVLYE